MKLKTLVIVVAALVLASAVVYLTNRPAAPTEADPRVGQAVLAPSRAETAATVEIASSGKTVSLRREGDQWRVASYHDLPADFRKLAEFIGQVTSAKIQRVVTARPDRLSRLGLDQNRIELSDGAGAALLSLRLGRSADSGGRFVQFAPEQKAYLAPLPTYLDADSRNWTDKTLLALKPEDIRELHLDDLKIVRTAADQTWTSPAPEGKALAIAKIDDWVRELCGLNWSDTAALDEPEVVAARASSKTFALKSADGVTTTIAVGRRPEVAKPKPEPSPEAKAETETEAAKEETIPAGRVYVFITRSDPGAPVNDWMKRRAFEIPSWTFERLPKSAADFWQDAPPPAP